MFHWFNKKTDEFVGLFLVVFLLAMAVFSVNAAKITVASDTMTRSKIGALANHAISFVTPNGAAEGTTIAIAFPPQFSASGMTQNDVDLLDNGLPVTTANDCSGTEQAAAVWSGNTLTFAICSGKGGSFTPGSTVGILIGTNAIDSGIGVDRVMNPPAAGSYRLTIGGTFGDSGYAPIAISQDDEVGVTACVGAVCNVIPPAPPAPVVSIVGGSTGPEQTPPPLITNLTIDQITSTTARVTWKTDIMSTSNLVFGPDMGYGTVRGDNIQTIDHEVVLLGLEPGTTYHLMARSVGYFGDVGLSSDQTFSTLAAGIAKPPVISNIRAVEIGGDDATIAWDTNVPAYSQLEYGRTAQYGSIVEDQKFSMAHELPIANLSPNTLYHFRITAIDSNGGIGISPDQTLTTFDLIAPKIFNIHVKNVSQHSFDVGWNTDKGATGGVKYGTSNSYAGGETLEKNGYTTAHEATLSGLLPATQYHFRIFQTDKNGNDAQSDDLTASTAMTPPEPGSSKAAETPAQIPKNCTAYGSVQLPVAVNNVPTQVTPNMLEATPGSIVSIELPPALTNKPIINGTVQVGDRLYELIKGLDGTYRANVAAPGAGDELPVTTVVNYTDGTSVYSQLLLKTAAFGTVYEMVNNGEVPVQGVLVTVLKDGKPWDGSKYGISDQILTGKDGTYSFFLPAGEYTLKAEKNGYNTSITNKTYYTGPVSTFIRLYSLPKEVVANSWLRYCGQKALELAKFSISKPVCAFPWLLLMIILAYIIYRLNKRNNDIKQAKDLK